MMRRLSLAALVGLPVLSGLTASAELPPEIWFSPCDGPSATCVSPPANEGPHQASAHAAGISVDHLAYRESRLTPIADHARELLARWESASRGYLPVTEAERLRLRFASPERSGHEIGLACEFQGRIDAEDLVRRYDWTTVSEIGNVVELTAIPKDAVERLFYKRFSVTLDAATWRPTAVCFGDAFLPGAVVDGAIALRPWVDRGDADGAVVVVSFEPPVDPVDEDDAERPIRTADLSDEPPRLLRHEAPLLLPPAPVPFDFVAPLEPVEAPKPKTLRRL